jgi:SNF family Na+-dependent transporter
MSITVMLRAVSLEGAWEGLIFFFQPVWEEVLDPKVTSMSTPFPLLSLP